MKKSFVMIAAVLCGMMMSMCLTSCNNNDPENLIVGTWKGKTAAIEGRYSEYTFTFDSKKNVEFTDEYYEGGSFWDGQTRKGTYELVKDGNTGSVHYTYAKIWGRGPAQEGTTDETEHFRYEFKGDTLIMTYSLDWERPGTYTLIKQK